MSVLCYTGTYASLPVENKGSDRNCVCVDRGRGRDREKERHGKKETKTQRDRVDSQGHMPVSM